MVLGMEPVNWLSCKSKYLQSTDMACDDAFKGPHVMPPLASTHSSSAMTMTPGRPQVHNHSPPTTWLSIKLQPASSGALRCRLHAGCLHTMRQGAACCSLKQEVQRTGELSASLLCSGWRWPAGCYASPSACHSHHTMTQARRRTSHTYPSPRALSPLTLRAEGWAMSTTSSQLHELFARAT